MKYKKQASNAISFVVATMKYRYDRTHKSLIIKSKEIIFLKLYHEYHLFEHNLSRQLKTKLLNQYAESFLVKRRIDKLAYELDLSVKFKIYLVISIIYLESTNASIDFYSRSISNYSNSIDREYDSNVSHDQVLYEVKKIIDRQKRTYNKRVV